VTITGTPTLALNDGGTATYDAGKSTSTALAFDYTVGAADMSVPSLAATTIDLPTGASINDAAGNPIASLSLTGLTQAGPQIDTAMPTVTTLTESPATGILGVGASVTFALAISKPVTVLGTPMLVLNDGGMATYDATGSTSTLLLFDYSVAATDVNVSSLAATGLNLSAGLAPARIVDAAGNALNSSSIAGLTQTGPQIDTPATFNFTPPDPSADVEGQTLLSFTSTGSNSFTISLDVDPNSAILENDGIRLVLGPAQYVSGGQSLTFTDAIVTSFSLSSVGETPIDTVAFSYNSALQDVAPAPQAVAESPATGTLGIGALDTLSVTMNEAVVVTGVPTLALNDGGTATYDAAKSTAATLVFDYTVAATDMSVPSLAATAINLPTGATIVDAGGRTITNLSLASLPQAGPEINTAVTMLTESPSTGTLYVGGSDTLTLTMNGAVAVTGTPTLALNDGGTATYDAAESTATSLAFDYRVAATDTSVASLAATTINLPTSASIDDTAGNPIAALSLTGLTQVGPQISIASPTFNFTPTNPSDDVEGQTVLSFSSTGPHSFTIAFDVDANSTIFENDGMKGALGPAQYVNGSQTQTFTDAIITSVNISSVGEIPFDNVSFSFASESVSCYWRGTLIRADRGEVPVEELAIGDMVLTLGGELRPIKWIGRRVVSRVFADPLHVLPIRIRAEALDKNVPSRDLVLSPDHAILCDDVMIQAGALVNGGSIVRETNVPETFTYYHVELDDHSLILAENTPAETFVDNVDRMGFDNWAEHEALYPDSNMIAEMPYPRAKAYRQVPRSIRKRLTDRAAMLTSDTRDFAA
jgi:Hint domain